MQTIWTRVAQVRATCHCPQCLPSTSAVARRATATATRRAPRFWTSSTVWYSGIFAVAATLDLGVKQQRRDQWNQAIADVKQDLARTDDVDANREFLDSLEQETVASQEMRENLDSSPLRPRMPEWPASLGQGRWESKLPPQSIYTDNRKKTKHLLDRWHPKKMERVQLSIDALQLGFFMELHRHGWHEEAAEAVPAWYAEHILQPLVVTRNISKQKHMDLDAVFRMKGKYSFGGEDEQAGNTEFASWERSMGDVPLCNYVQDELGDFHNTAYDLNDSLRDLFNLGRRRVLSQPAVLAKVYHNLSVSSAPPNIDTYNTLIVGLSDIGTRRLVEDCIDSLQCAKMRHNEVSLASILNYYTLTGNDVKFQYWVQMMHGHWGGLALAQPGVKINESSQGRLLLRKEDGVKVVQRPSPTPMVFNALINGVIKFSGFETALSVCEAARAEGWGLCINGLHTLLKDCSRRRDWDAGLATWTQIQALRTITEKNFEAGRWKAPAIDLPTFASMLQLCTRCNNRTAFQETMEQAIAMHPKSAKDLIRMVRLERTEMQTSDQVLRSADVELKPLTDITRWLEKQDLHQYGAGLETMSQWDLVRLKNEQLKDRGVVQGSSRRKLLGIFNRIRDLLPFTEDGQHSWLPQKELDRFRKSIKKKRAQLEANPVDWRQLEIVRDEASGKDLAQASGEESPQATQHDEPTQQARLAELMADGEQQGRSYAVDLTCLPEQMSLTTYQPIGG